MPARVTYASNRLRDTNGSGNAEDLPEEVEKYPLLRNLQKRLVWLDEAWFPDQIEDFGHNAVAFEAAPLSVFVSWLPAET